MYKKLIIVALLAVGISSSIVTLGAEEVSTANNPFEPRIETIDQYAFFVADLSKSTLKPAYGDTVELVFSKNKRIKLYNISTKGIRYFTDSEGKLIAFITPENLRYFQNQTLKKVIIKQDGKKEIIKISAPVGQIQD